MTAWRVLIADDDHLSLQLMRDSLAKLSVAVLEARDGEEVMRLAKAEGPDLILLDVMLPRMDGFQVAALLKQDPATAEIPVMFVSALGAPKDKVRGLNLGAEDYIVKPIHPEELQVRVQMVFRRIQPSRRGAPMASGQLAAMNLPSLIQMFEGERRTARLLLTRGDRLRKRNNHSGGAGSAKGQGGRVPTSHLAGGELPHGAARHLQPGRRAGGRADAGPPHGGDAALGRNPKAPVGSGRPTDPHGCPGGFT